MQNALVQRSGLDTDCNGLDRSLYVKRQASERAAGPSDGHSSGKAPCRRAHRFRVADPYHPGMAPEPIDRPTSLQERVEVVEDFLDVASRLVTVGDLKWAAVEVDYRLLAINAALRRQLESLRAAVLLAQQD